MCSRCGRLCVHALSLSIMTWWQLVMPPSPQMRAVDFSIKYQNKSLTFYVISFPPVRDIHKFAALQFPVHVRAHLCLSLLPNFTLHHRNDSPCNVLHVWEIHYAHVCYTTHSPATFMSSTCITPLDDPQVYPRMTFFANRHPKRAEASAGGALLFASTQHTILMSSTG
jgi:hypothetical protein